MKMLLLTIPLSVALANAAETPLERMFDSKLTSAQRMDACFVLRGDESKPVAQANNIESLRSEARKLRAIFGKSLGTARANVRLSKIPKSNIPITR